MFCAYFTFFWVVMYLEAMCEMHVAFLCLRQLFIRTQKREVDSSVADALWHAAIQLVHNC